MKKKIMILGASILQLPAIKKAKEMGLLPIVVDMNPRAVGFSEGNILKEVISTIDIPAVVDAAKRHRVDGVMTLASDMPMRCVAAVAKELGIVGISDETAIKATDKGEMRKALAAHNVPIPKFHVVSSKQEFDEIVPLFTTPFIVKPADNSGSRGVNLLSDDSDPSVAYDYAAEYSRDGEILVEEFMEGAEVSVETIAVNGEVNVLQITDKITTGAPYFVETGHTQPSRLDAATKEEIKRVAIAANKAIGIKSGPSHTEIKVTKDGPKIVALGARLGGDCITTHLVPLSTGVDMVECCIKIALGESPDITVKCDRGSAIRYFEQGAGVIEKIDGLDDAEESDGVNQVSVVHGVGEEVTEIVNSASRVGFVIADGATADEAATNAENAAKKVKVVIRKDKNA